MDQVNAIRFRYDAAPRLWVVEPVESSGGHQVLAKRIVLDAPAKPGAEGWIHTSATMKADEVAALPAHGAVVEKLRLVRGAALPGVADQSVQGMLEWVVAWVEGSGWVCYRHEREDVLVTAAQLELDCHGITSEGRLHCRAEMLLEGSTNRQRSVMGARHVKLRTLTRYNQRILVPTIRTGSKATPPGGRKK